LAVTTRCPAGTDVGCPLAPSAGGSGRTDGGGALDIATDGAGEADGSGVATGGDVALTVDGSGGSVGGVGAAAVTWPFNLSQERQREDFWGRAGDRSDRSGGDATQVFCRRLDRRLQIHRGSRKSRNINHGRKYQKHDFPRNMVNNKSVSSPVKFFTNLPPTT